MPNLITILNTRAQNIATKTYQRMSDGRIKEDPYRCGSMFSRVEHEVGSIGDLFGLVRLLETEATSMIIRGQIRPELADRWEVTRTLHDDPIKGQVAMFKDFDDGLNWMMCDFDKINLPPDMTATMGIEMLVKTLPAEFHDASYCYQLSSSAGIAGVKWNDAIGAEEEHYQGWYKLSAHVFFWLKHKTHNLAQWAENLNATRGVRVIDPAPLRTVQPNYTARPKFINMADPLGDARTGFVQKAVDKVDLVWIDKPVHHVKVDGVSHLVGATVMQDGMRHIATPSLQDRFDLIVPGNRREGLKCAIGYYFWYHGTDGSEAEIIHLLHAAFPGGIKDYLDPGKLSALVRWFAQRASHAPVYQDKKDADVLAARLVQLRENATPFPDAAETARLEDLTFDTEDSCLSCYFIGDECGAGKTEWLIDRIGNQPDLYIICLPRIELIREVERRLHHKYPNIEANKGYVVKTIYTERENDIRDAEDAPDVHSPTGATVREQVAKFRTQIKHARRVVLFITHAALLLGDWHDWSNFHLIVDEIPDPYQTYTRNFRNSGEFVHRLVDIDGEETNYYRLSLTDHGYHKVSDNAFDDIEAPIRGLLEAINTNNVSVYALKQPWDEMHAQKVQLMRLTDAHLLRPFRSTTFMGDEFAQSTMALAFANKYSVDWLPHPDWQPSRTRAIALKDRARIFYFATKDDRRGSITHYEDAKLIPKLLAWFSQSGNYPGQTLITCNRRFEHYFEKPKAGLQEDVETDEGVVRVIHAEMLKLLWVPPKLAGTDIYKGMCNVAFFAAMRPGGDETAFVQKSLSIHEEAIIRWREYNTLYQFIMRICLRQFESREVANVYVFDEYQAEYLRDRFGGCLEYCHVPGVVEAKAKKGGRPRKPLGEALTSAQKKRNQRARGR